MPLAPHYSGNPTIHQVEFNLMGVMVTLPGFKEGDWVQYGGMLYKPEGKQVEMFGKVYEDCVSYVFQGEENVLDQNKCCWPYGSGQKHYASLSKEGLFYCS